MKIKNDSKSPLVIIILTAFILFTVACAKLHQVPDGINTTDNLFQDQLDAEAAVNAIYTSMGTNPIYNQFHETIQSQGTDDAEWGFGRNTSNADKLALDKFTFTPSTRLIYQYWEVHYRNINRANVALHYIAPMDNIPEEKKRQYMGEAYFIRALMYFNLVRTYGSIPLMLEATESLDDLEVARSSIEEVYAQVVSDLQLAKENLPEVYEAKDLGRATRGAAMAMLTDVYITQEQWQNAADEAKAISNMGLYALWPTYAEVFEISNKNKRESLFEIQYKSLRSEGTTNGSNYAGYFKPPAAVIPIGSGTFGGYGDNPVTENHYRAYSPGDPRREVNVLHVSGAPATILYPYYVNKYQDPSAFNQSDGGNNYYIYRYADILLMYAEALNELSPGSLEAYLAFNEVRRRAYGLPLKTISSRDLTAGLSQEQFRDSILLERRLEFAFEGKRRFDLLRMGKLTEAMRAQDPSILVDDRHTLFPLPQDELIVNRLLDQNPGW